MAGNEKYSAKVIYDLRKGGECVWQLLDLLRCIRIKEKA